MIKRNRVVITGMGVLAPNGIGLEAFWDSLLAGRSGIGPITSEASIPQAPATTIADRIGTSAHAATISSACPSGLDAMAHAAAMISSGEAEIAIAGGTDAPITPLVMGSFVACGLSSCRN